jgi:hypothetical protein
MANESTGEDEARLRRERKTRFGDGSLGRACLITFAASAAATLIICGAVRAPESPELWNRIQNQRVVPTAKRQAKRTSAASRLSVSEQTSSQG